MARPTNTTGYAPKGIYRTPLTTDGQYMVASSGATVDIYGKFIGEAGSSMTIAGNIDLTGKLNIGAAGRLFNTVTVHTSNSTAISNYGIKLLSSTEDIKMRIAAPVTGSWVKLVMTSTNAVDNAVYSFIVTTNDSRKARFGSSGRTLSVSTNAYSKIFKWVELIGSTHGATVSGAGKCCWLVSGAGPSSGPVSYTVTTSTA